MGIKAFVREHSPKIILPLLSFVYHKAAYPIRKYRYLKYLPYYQDELSREILYDRVRYAWTIDDNIFLRRAEKNAMKFNNATPFEDIYSGIVVLYDKDNRNIDYTCSLLIISQWSEKYRLLHLKDFLAGSEISENEFVFVLLSNKGLMQYKDYTERKNLHYQSSYYAPYAIREDLQYFDMFEPVDDEIIIDAGAYDGTTALDFLKWGKGKVKHIYSFELDPVNIPKCQKNLKDSADKVTLINKGTWDKDETIFINAHGTTGTSVVTKGSDKAFLTSIDSVVKDEAVTFIKMDVEGAELKSLMGAQNTIKRNRPRLAICVYHRPEDLYQIPEYILSLVPEYRFYLRHYGSNQWETILYAFCE